MSYGVVGSKSGHLLVETLTGVGGTSSDAAFDRFQSVWGATWVPGRLTLTALHLTFMPNRVGRGSAMLKIDLRDLTGVELGTGVVQRTVGLRTPGHVGRLRCIGAPALAEHVAALAEAARHAPSRPPRGRAGLPASGADGGAGAAPGRGEDSDVVLLPPGLTRATGPS